MSRFHSHINTLGNILSSYDGAVPLSDFLRSFFAKDKKFGSKDRKEIAHFTYLYYRAGYLFADERLEEKIKSAVFLCESKPSPLLSAERNRDIALPVPEKLRLEGFLSDSNFPFIHFLSPQIDREAFCRSMFIQPSFFLRLRPGSHDKVIDCIKEGGLSFHPCGNDCLRFESSLKVSEVISVDRDAVVQDLQSQHVLDFFKRKEQETFFEKPVQAWDCCAGSGGKSILLHDLSGGMANITVSDNRKNILKNLKDRLLTAAVPVKNQLQVDLSEKTPFENKFDLIVCDAPCSGSGTWSRTPERMHFYKGEMTGDFAGLQGKIIANTMPALLPGGIYIYITCSVFSAENEDSVSHMIEKYPLQLLESGYLSGYDQGADTMYVAVFRKKSISDQA